MDSNESAIQTVLPQLDRAKLETVVGELVSKLGVEGPDDLQFIKEEDGRLTHIQCRKIIHSFKSGKNSSIAAFHFYVNVEYVDYILMTMIPLTLQNADKIFSHF